MSGAAFPAGFFGALGPVPESLLDPVTFLIEPSLCPITSAVQPGINSVALLVRSMVNTIAATVKDAVELFPGQVFGQCDGR
ncbi:MAG: hypothetical protein AB1Z51_05340 [Desulfuromonadales bacterium]